MAADLTGPTVSEAEAHILGRLHTVSHYCALTMDAGCLEQLHELAVSSPGVGERVVLLVAYGLEEARSRCRPAGEAAAAWAALRARGERLLQPGDPLLMGILSRYAQYTGGRGSPADLDEAVRLCRQEWQRRRNILGEGHYWSQLARADLAAALRERGREEDLCESLCLLRGQVAYRRSQHGDAHAFTWAAQGSLAATLVKLAEWTGDAEGSCYAAEAAEVAGALADACRDGLGRDDAATLRAHLVHAHALILLGEPRAAVRELRYVKAVARRTGACLGGGQADLLIARAEAAGDDPARLDGQMCSR